MASYSLPIKSSDKVVLDGILSGHCLESVPLWGSPIDEGAVRQGEWVVIHNLEVTTINGSIINAAFNLATKLDAYKLIEVPKEGLTETLAEIDRIVADPDSYEPGEEHPSGIAIVAIKNLLTQAKDAGALFPQKSDVSTFHGELDVTWHSGSKTLRLVTYSNGRLPLLYFCTDAGEALTRGQTIQPATAQQLSERLAWLVG